MKKLLPTRFVLYILLTTFIMASVIGCVKKRKDYNTVFTDKPSEVKSTIDFKLLNSLNESNRKVIDVASIAFNQTKDLKKLRLFLKIKKDHQKMGVELKKITAENLIIIPKPLYRLNLNQNFLKGTNATYYLVTVLETEIRNQINILQNIEQTAQNTKFKTFAQKSKDILIDNKQNLNAFLNI